MNEPDDRAEAALRAAMDDHQLAEVPPDLGPGAVRRRLRRRRIVGGALAGIVVVALAAGIVPRWAGPSSDGLTAGPPTATGVPAGWRVEQYRSVSVQVPDSWGYASAPRSDWCVASPEGQDDPTKPYVSLGAPEVTTAIHCGELPAEKLREHVELFATSDASSAPEDSSISRSGWQIVTRTFAVDPQQTVVLVVVSRDRSTVDEIVDSVQVTGEGRCAPTSGVQQLGSRAAATNVEALRAAEEIVICQYDPTGEGVPGGLHAARLVAGSAARDLATDLAAALENGEKAATSCSQDRAPVLELAATVQVAGSAEIFVTRGVCIDPADANTTFGGVDGGGPVRELTGSVCRQIVQLPIRMSSMNRGFAGCGR